MPRDLFRIGRGDESLDSLNQCPSDGPSRRSRVEAGTVRLAHQGFEQGGIAAVDRTTQWRLLVLLKLNHTSED